MGNVKRSYYRSRCVCANKMCSCNISRPCKCHRSALASDHTHMYVANSIRMTECPTESFVDGIVIYKNYIIHLL